MLTCKQMTDIIEPSDMAESTLNKVQCAWYFYTPRGQASVYTYWWNESNEMSIGAQKTSAAMWMAAWIRTHGYRAGCGTLSDIRFNTKPASPERIFK